MIDPRLDTPIRERLARLGVDWRNGYVGERQGELVAFPADLAKRAGAKAIEPLGLATVDTALEPLRAIPAHRAELLSEIRGGEFLDLLGIEGEWALVRGEDGYVGWLARWMLSEQTPERRQALLARWVGRYAAPRGTLWSSDHWASSPLTLGTPLLAPEDDGIRERAGEHRVSLPWGAQGWLSRLDLAAAGLGTSEEAMRAATQLLGTPYRWGGRGLGGVDCSGYVQLCWEQAGVRLPRDAAQQMQVGAPLALAEREQWQAGDLLCFGQPADHVGLYDGRGALLHARGCVRRQSLSELEPLMNRLSAVRRVSGSPAATQTLWFRPPGERILPA